MSAQKFAAIACACALALNCTASPILANTPPRPAAALNLPSPSEPSTFSACVVGDERSAPADDSNDDAAEGATDGATKKGGHSFARALTAPFRALARLFGGGKKDSQSSDAAKAKRQSTNDVANAQPAVRKNDRAQGDNASSVKTSASAAAATATSVLAKTAPALTTLPAPATTLPTTTLSNAAPPASPSKTTAATLSAPATPPSVTSARQPATQPEAPFMPLVVGVPHDPISQGRALIEQGLIESAISELSVAAATGVNLLEANNLLGLAYDHRGQHKEAQEFYQRALTVAPNDAHVINNLGYSLYLDDRYKEALAKLKHAAQLDPSSREISNNLGFVYGRLNKYDDAFRNFSRAGGDLYARFQTGLLLEAAGRDRDAIRQYEAARRLEPASSDVLRRLINLYNRTGQRDKAEAAERSLEQPKSKATGSTIG